MNSSLAGVSLWAEDWIMLHDPAGNPIELAQVTRCRRFAAPPLSDGRAHVTIIAPWGVAKLARQGTLDP